MTTTTINPGAEPSTARPATARKRRSWRLPVFLGTAILVAAGLVAAVAPAQAATIDAGDWYVVVNRNSGKVLDVAGSSTADAAVIDQWTRNNGTNQQFRFESAGSGYWRIIARHSGKAVDLWEWNTADGAEYRQWPITSGENQQFSVQTIDGYVQFINRLSGKALEVWEWSTADGARISQFTDANGANQQWQLVKVATGSGSTATTTSSGGGSGGGSSTTGLVGWATQNGGTTGGGSAASVTVTSASALDTALKNTAASNIRISGMISLSGMHKVTSNKTITGVGSGSGITGGGLTLSGVKNVIIRNLNFRNADDDSINVESGSTNIWIDHNDLASGYDGLVDIKRGSDFITVSWNHTHDHDKNMLLGHSDDNGSQDKGHLRVTYHHNWYDKTKQRNPRVRFGNPVHVFNNYFNGNSGYGVASTEGAGVLVESNYFESVSDPFHLGEADSGPGTIVARNNYLTGSGSGQSGGSVASIPYSYSPDAASSVKSIVTSGAGTGKIGL